MTQTLQASSTDYYMVSTKLTDNDKVHLSYRVLQYSTDTGSR